ncbi:MAG TPA: isoprenylcysteine carboxylmethyltransferase family protein [Hyphomicrobiaceae bacterium]|jgi:protein-S-isoprenylcysteine O-methyltransferase Ste14|nr:isoprenylcysteine carboxylmethyltransferase family protein [Hyphomicrobiaceae bacterium]
MRSRALAAAAPPVDPLQKVQRARKWMLRGLLALSLVPIFVTDTYWYNRAPLLYHGIERLGVLLIVACILGRTWCALYIGGRKKRELVMYGPYSLSRNPLYLFSMIGAFGIGAQSGSLTIAGWFTLMTFLVFRSVVRNEEQYLAGQFPNEFPAYARRVPRFWPRPSRWQDVEELLIRPKTVQRTFVEASLFLLSIPAADLLEMLQRDGVIPVLFLLP